MAVAFRSFSSTGFVGDGSAVVTKPSGLVAGDVMIVTLCSASSSATIDSPSGWTLLASGSPETGTVYAVYYKVADSSDVAASDFTFTFTNGGTNTEYGSIVALSDSAVDFVTDTGTSANAGAVYTGGITPPQASSFLYMIGISGSQAHPVDSYNVTTSNPTWTERDEKNTSVENDATVAIASAIRTEATATGDFGMTWNIANNSIGVLIGVGTAIDSTQNPSVITKTATINAPTVSGDANISPSVVSKTASVQAPTVTTEDGKWSNKAKSSAPSYTNKAKS